MVDSKEFDEVGYKQLAKLFLIRSKYQPRGILVPTRAEWIGLNLLERDDEINDNDWKVKDKK